MRDVRIIWIMVKPGETRFYAFTRMPGKEWLDAQRANGYKFFKASVDLPREFDLPMDWGVTSDLQSEDTAPVPTGASAEDGARSPYVFGPRAGATPVSEWDKFVPPPWVGWVNTKPDPTSTQVGGDHYQHYAIQPIDFLQANEIPFVEACVIQYVCRWQSKGGIEDLEKARHYLDLKIAYEKNKNAPTPRRNCISEDKT